MFAPTVAATFVYKDTLVSQILPVISPNGNTIRSRVKTGADRPVFSKYTMDRRVLRNILTSNSSPWKITEEARFGRPGRAALYRHRPTSRLPTRHSSFILGSS